MKSRTYSSAKPGAKPGSGAKTLCFDLDGTLCTNTFGDYENAEPFGWAIARVNELARAGHRIIVFTARGTATGIDWESVTRAQLERWGVACDDLRLGKPSADVYIDDRTVHTSAWREGDAFGVPGWMAPLWAGTEDVPGLPPPLRTAIAESGRTLGGEPFLLEAHIERALALANACRLHALPDAATVSQAVMEALDAAMPAADRSAEDLIFTISIAGGPDAAYVDTLDALPTARMRISCRRLHQSASGLGRLLDPAAAGTLALAAEIDRPASTRAWPLETTTDGSLRDALGGRLAVSQGGEVRLAPDASPAAVISGWLEELGRATGLTVSERPLSLGDIRDADEVFVASAVLGLLPVTLVDGEPVARTGAAREALAAEWSRRAGVDVMAQVSVAALSSPAVGQPT